MIRISGSVCTFVDALSRMHDQHNACLGFLETIDTQPYSFTRQAHIKIWWAYFLTYLIDSQRVIGGYDKWSFLNGGGCTFEDARSTLRVRVFLKPSPFIGTLSPSRRTSKVGEHIHWCLLSILRYLQVSRSSSCIYTLIDILSMMSMFHSAHRNFPTRWIWLWKQALSMIH